MIPIKNLIAAVSLIFVLIVSAALTVAYTRKQAPAGHSTGHSHTGSQQHAEPQASGEGSMQQPSEPSEIQMEASRKQLEASRAQLEASRKMLEAVQTGPASQAQPQKTESGQPPASPARAAQTPDSPSTPAPKADDGHAHQH